MSTQTLYRHFAKDGGLLYIGVSSRVPQRIREHSKHSDWWANIAKIEMEHFDDRAKVLDAERRAIMAEKPAHNFAHNRVSPPKEPQASALIGRDNITARMVALKPLYRENEAGGVIGVTTAVIRNEIAGKRLGYVDIASPRSGKLIRYVTGWQLIDWLEQAGGK